MAGEVVAALRAELGAEVVLTGENIPERNRDDWSGLPPTQPLAVLRPRTTAEVAAALRVCHAHRQPGRAPGRAHGPVRGRAGRRGRGGALARADGRRRGDRLRDRHHDRPGRHAARARAAGGRRGRLLRPARPGARGSCAIGGNISTNAGGNRVIRYGMTREMVLGLEVVLADGTVLPSLNKLIKNNAGIDLKHLFIGSEGTLGVVTRAVLRLQPKPTSVQAAFCALADFGAVLAPPPGRPRRPGPRALGLRGDVARLLPLRDDPPGCSRPDPRRPPVLRPGRGPGHRRGGRRRPLRVLARAHPRDRHHRRRRPRPVAR